MKRVLLNVEGMSCTHCVNAISKSLKLLHGVREFKVSLKKKTVMVEYEETKVSLDSVKENLRAKGYDSVEI